MAYERVNWENLPSKNTPVNATNLNKLNDVYTKTETDTKLNKKVNTSDLIDLIYPVGSIYMSANNVSPASFLGGTWQQIKDKFLLSAGDTYNAGDEGGEATHTLTINELPKHDHTIYIDEPGTGGKWGPTGTVQQSTSRFTSTGNAGGNQPHNNMPPYLAVYMWKRIT